MNEFDAISAGVFQGSAVDQARPEVRVDSPSEMKIQGSSTCNLEALSGRSSMNEWEANHAKSVSPRFLLHDPPRHAYF